MAQFKTYLKIDKSNLNANMALVAPLIYNFGLKQAGLEDELLRLELKLEIVESKIGSNKRTNYSNVNRAATKLKLTETLIKDQVKGHPEIIEIKEEIIEVKQKLRIAKLKCRSLYVKKDMIENISHNIREERKASKKIKE